MWKLNTKTTVLELSLIRRCLNNWNELLASFPPQEVAMNRISKLAVALSLASTASLAQSSVKVFPFLPLQTNCPIALRATLEKRGNILGAQRVQLTFWPSFGIVASRITVHGIAPAAKSPEPSEISESLDLNPIVDYPRPPNVSTVNVPHDSKENDMPWLPPPGQPVLVVDRSPDTRWYAWVVGFTAIHSIDLDSVNYADGTSWQVANGKPCRVPVGSSPW
jgi:hypothetical protein